jgi:hypothetical protein
MSRRVQGVENVINARSNAQGTAHRAQHALKPVYIRSVVIRHGTNKSKSAGDTWIVFLKRINVYPP